MSKPHHSLEEHLKHEHGQSKFTEYLKEIIYGGIDGIVTTFAVVAGFTGAAVASTQAVQLSFLTVLLFGIANLFADGFSMGLGNFLSIRAEQALYKKAKSKERNEIIYNTEMEIYETKEILMEKGFTEQDAVSLVTIYQKNEDYWVDWMMHHELEMPNVEDEKPILNGTATFLSFLFFGAIPLLPFMIGAAASTLGMFYWSVGAAATALFLLGVLKWRVTGSRFSSAVLEVMIVGAAAGSVAYFVGLLFDKFV